MAKHFLVQCQHLADESRHPADLEAVELAVVEGLQGELPLPGAIEQRGVALEAEEERMLLDDRSGEGVVGLDGQLVGIDVLAVGERVEDAPPHFLLSPDREGEAARPPRDVRPLRSAARSSAGASGLAGAGSSDPIGPRSWSRIRRCSR